MRTLQLIVLLSALTLASSSLCSMCIRTNELLQEGLIRIAPTFIAKDVVKSVCEKQYESEELCQRVAEELTPLALRMGVRAVVKTGPMCAALCPTGFYHKLNIDKEIASIMAGEAALSSVEELPVSVEQLKVDEGRTRILHMTDIHLDLNYTVNSSITCNMPICCHQEHGMPQAAASQAPEFGSPRCDTPMPLLDSALEFAKNLPKIDAIVVTGDFSAHNEWQKTPETVVKVRKLVEDKLGESIKAPMVSAAGNNQYLPDHQVDPTTYPEEAVKVVEITRGDKTATLISLNTLFCDSINLYLLQDQTMPIRQLKTLAKVLQTRENVFLLAHIAPTSPSCAPTYATLFRALLTKYSHKIKGQFYGHTHLDQFIVNTDPRDNSTATSYALLAGSLSPLGTNQPRLRVYELNSELELINYDDFAFSMSKLEWSSNYNFKQYYGLPLEQPINGKLLQGLQQRMHEEVPLRQKYSAKASASSAGGKYYCQTFDTQAQIEECNGEQVSFRGKVNDLLSMLQGQWGAYGTMVQ